MAEREGSRKEVESRLELAWRAVVEAASSTTSPLALPPDRRRPFRRTALLAELEEVREDFRRIASLLDDEVSGRFVNAGWTLKDLLAHLASWAREFRLEVETVHRHESFDYVIPYAMSVLGPTEWNEKEVQARRELPLSRLFDELDEETARLQELVLEISDADLYGVVELPISPTGDPGARLRGPTAFIISGKCLHDRHHIAQIHGLLRRFRE